jgi:pyruvate kinase
MKGGNMSRKAKIIATIGPSSSDKATLKRLFLAGMDVARLNFSHGTHEEHRQVILSLRQLSDETKKPVSILQDLQGPKLRVGQLPPEGISLNQNDRVRLFSAGENVLDKENKESIAQIPVELPEIFEVVKKGNSILLDDGEMELTVDEVYERELTAKVKLGGILYSHKGINLPGVQLKVNTFTEKDREDLVFGIKNGIDLVALSFVHTADDMRKLRQSMQDIDPEKSDIPIIAKLERPEAIDHLDEILEISDGVMVARGDLAVETSPDQVPIYQKEIIQSANRQGKIVITATQMLESMMQHSRPTRAEASDVANAIFDGTDIVMLSGETAVGRFPAKSIETMSTIVLTAEQNFPKWGHLHPSSREPAQDDATSTTRAARELAHDRNVELIVVFTVSGRTALLMSKERPCVPIIAFTPNQRTYQRLNIFWGVRPFLVPFASSVEEMINHVEANLLSNQVIQSGKQVVIVCGYPVGKRCPPNLALLHTIS